MPCPECEAVVAWMWFEGFDGLPGSAWNSTTDPEVAKAMQNLGMKVMPLRLAEEPAGGQPKELSPAGRSDGKSLDKQL